MLCMLRSCFILNIWRQANNARMNIMPITQYGWIVQEDGAFTIEWDTEENIQTIRDRIVSLIKGCKGVSGCATKRCGCKKKMQFCYAGYECTNYTNILQSTQPEVITISDTEMREIALQENDQLSNEVDVIVGE